MGQFLKKAYEGHTKKRPLLSGAAAIVPKAGNLLCLKHSRSAAPVLDCWDHT